MKENFAHLEPRRVRGGEYKSETGSHFGAFLFVENGIYYKIIADDGKITGWEHVSVSVSYRNRKKKLVHRLPTWTDMVYVKNLFWEKDEVVVQFHPAENEYVNVHNYVLHLWKCRIQEFPTPPVILV